MKGLGVLVLLLLAPFTAAAEQFFEVYVADRPVTVATSGLVVSTEVLRFGPPPSGNWQTTIAELAQEGQRVREGDLLVRFDSSNLDDDLTRVSGQLAQRRNELLSLDEWQRQEIEDEGVALAAAESEARKADRKAEQPEELIPGIEYRKLVEEKRIANVLMRRARERQALSLRLREARRQELETGVRQLGVKLASVEKELASFTIRAPRPGLVVLGTDYEGNKVDVNASVHPGLVVVRLADDSQLAVHAEIHEHAAARLAVGQRVSVAIDSAGEADLVGRISRVANTVRRRSRYSDSMVRDITVEIDPGQPPVLRLGMSVQIEVELSMLKEALAIPASVLVYRSGSPGVVLRGQGWRPVLLGERSADMFIVEDGLEEGDMVRL
ncbi:MAG: HlyD family efflux transporter periplasmic adaptor subunit [Gammaproteobacteria bacterium]|nr:HlyD family efflux transporter periplasmic adaptor subunit [Gammaproteobacteria bacterium]